MADAKISALTDGSVPAATDYFAVARAGSLTRKLSAQSLGLPDGWFTAGETWTYASASTFTVAGVNVTAKYTKGTRIKFTQTTVKYGVVVASSFSTDTTVTIAVNTDYTIANAAITENYYSYQTTPQGYPTWFNYTTTPAGWAASPTVVFARFQVTGNLCFLDLRITGTSNATTATATAPIAAEDTADNVGRLVGVMVATDNSLSVATPARCFITDASTTLTFGKDLAGAAWTASGAKNVMITGAYAI